MVRIAHCNVNEVPTKHIHQTDIDQTKRGAFAPRFVLTILARPERFELPTTKFVAWYSIQLSYGRKQGAEL